jgi:hypothetical protein
MKKTVLFLMMLSIMCISVAKADEYNVTGFNLITGERVVGHMDDVDDNGTVTGRIWDRTTVLYTVGQWSGLGKAILVSEEPAVAYAVEVVE